MEECEYKFKGDMKEEGMGESRTKTWDEYQQEMGKKKLTKYLDNSVAIKKIRKEKDFKRKYKSKKYEKETDKLFDGGNNNN